VFAFFGSTFLANKNDPKNGLAFDAYVEHPAQKGDFVTPNTYFIL
jgi:hypothetical protein